MVLVSAATVSAHGRLVSAVPAVGSTVTAAPRELRLTFTEATRLASTRIVLMGPDSVVIALGPIEFADSEQRVVLTRIDGQLRAGRHVVQWQMAGKDGHPIRGTYSFIIASGSTGLPSDTAAGHAGHTPGEAGAAVAPPGQAGVQPEHHPAAGETGFDASSPVYVVTRWVQFAALLATLGAVVFGVLVVPRTLRNGMPAAFADTARTRAARVGFMAGGILAVTAFVRIFMQSYALHGPQDAFDLRLIGGMVQQTIWGWGWVLEVVALGIVLTGFRKASKMRDGWLAAALGAAMLAFVPALSGHAVAVTEGTSLVVLGDALHVAGAAGWLGSLLLLVAVGIPVAIAVGESGEGHRHVASVVNAYSPTALVFAGLAATTGLLAAVVHLESVAALWRTDYGRMLLLKLGVLSGAVGTGAYNWLRVRPSLGLSPATGRLQRSASFELFVGIMVLLVTAVLVATPPGTAMPEAADPVDTAVSPP